MSDGTGLSGEDTAELKVVNESPRITLFDVPSTGTEATKINVNAVANDAGGTADPLAFSWQVTGPAGFSVSSKAAGFAFTPPDNGIYTVSLSVTDDDGGKAIDSTNVDVANVPPTAKLTAFPAKVNEGDAGFVNFSDQNDVASPDNLEGLFRYSYDFDGDGVFGEPGEKGDGTYAGGVSNESQVIPASYFADGPGTRTVNARIVDKDNGGTTYPVTITIENVAPHDHEVLGARDGRGRSKSHVQRNCDRPSRRARHAGLYLVCHAARQLDKDSAGSVTRVYVRPRRQL